MLDTGFGALAQDSTTNNFDGTLSGEVSWIPGYSGMALKFDGGVTNGHVEVPTVEEMNFGIRDSFAVTAWVKSPPEVAETQMLLGKQGSGY